MCIDLAVLRKYNHCSHSIFSKSKEQSGILPPARAMMEMLAFVKLDHRTMYDLG